MVEYLCAECGVKIERYIKPSYAAKKENLYCSRECANIGLNKGRRGKTLAELEPPDEDRALCGNCGWNTGDLSRIGEVCPVCTFYRLERNSIENRYKMRELVAL